MGGEIGETRGTGMGIRNRVDKREWGKTIGEIKGRMQGRPSKLGHAVSQTEVRRRGLTSYERKVPTLD